MSDAKKKAEACAKGKGDSHATAMARGPVEEMFALYRWAERRRQELRERVEHLDRMLAAPGGESKQLRADRELAAAEQREFDAELTKLADPSKPHRHPYSLRAQWGSDSGHDSPGDWRRDVGTGFAVAALIQGCKESETGVPGRAQLSEAARDLVMVLEVEGRRVMIEHVRAQLERDIDPDTRRVLLDAENRTPSKLGKEVGTGLQWEIFAAVAAVLGLRASAVRARYLKIQRAEREQQRRIEAEREQRGKDL